MDTDLERKFLETEYRNLVRILTDQGLEVPDIQVENLSDHDLAAAVRRFRLLARTPH